jgi:hypothetical protein
VFLLTLTVVDDFLAVSIIGIVYSEEIRIVPLLIALASLVGLWLLGRTRTVAGNAVCADRDRDCGSHPCIPASMPPSPGWPRGC